MNGDGSNRAGPGLQRGALELLISRRSRWPLADPAPVPAPVQLNMVLDAALRAPDYGQLQPWRFVLVRGQATMRWAKCSCRPRASATRKARQSACASRPWPRRWSSRWARTCAQAVWCSGAAAGCAGRFSRGVSRAAFARERVGGCRLARGKPAP